MFFMHKAARAEFASRGAELFFAVIAHDDDASIGKLLSELARCGEPIHARHLDVHEHPVGQLSGVTSQHLAAISALGDDAGGQKRAQRLAERRVVIDDQESSDAWFGVDARHTRITTNCTRAVNGGTHTPQVSVFTRAARCFYSGLWLEASAILKRELQQAMAALEVQLRAHVRPVVLHRARADAEFFSDLFARLIRGDEFQDAALGRRE